MDFLLINDQLDQEVQWLREIRAQTDCSMAYQEALITPDHRSGIRRASKPKVKMCIPPSFARTSDGVKDSHCLPRVIPRLAHELLRRDWPYRSSATWGTGEQPYYYNSPSILSSAAPPGHSPDARVPSPKKYIERSAERG
ncbi:hypothetical protein VTN02DRAFT_6486 [Thermoascus thermophilus]